MCVADRLASAGSEAHTATPGPAPFAAAVGWVLGRFAVRAPGFGRAASGRRGRTPGDRRSPTGLPGKESQPSGSVHAFGRGSSAGDNGAPQPACRARRASRAVRSTPSGAGRAQATTALQHRLAGGGEPAWRSSADFGRARAAGGPHHVGPTSVGPRGRRPTSGASSESPAAADAVGGRPGPSAVFAVFGQRGEPAGRADGSQAPRSRSTARRCVFGPTAAQEATSQAAAEAPSPASRKAPSPASRKAPSPASRRAPSPASRRAPSLATARRYRQSGAALGPAATPAPTSLAAVRRRLTARRGLPWVEHGGVRPSACVPSKPGRFEKRERVIGFRVGRARETRRTTAGRHEEGTFGGQPNDATATAPEPGSSDPVNVARARRRRHRVGSSELDRSPNRRGRRAGG
jgi:hypothetical protein